MAKCIEKAEDHCKSYPRCYGCGACREPTNADRIRSMSDEELVEILQHGCCPYIEDECTMKGCEECISDWLKQPARDGE
jgi:hypothetical protein